MKTYSYLFLAAWLIWLMIVIFSKKETNLLVPARIIPAKADSFNISGIKYCIVPDGSAVENTQLIGYKKEKTEVTAMSKLNAAIQQFDKEQLIKLKIEINDINDIEINNLYARLISNNTKESIKQKKQTKLLSRKVPTNKTRLVQEAQENLHRLQQLFSERKASLDELKRASDKLAEYRNMPEYRQTSVQVEIVTPVATRQSANSPTDKKELADSLRESIRKWFLANEVKSPVAGIFHIEHGNYFVVKGNSDTAKLVFQNQELKENSYTVNVMCKSESAGNYEAIRSAQGSYYISIIPSQLSACLPSEAGELKVRVNTGRQSVLMHLVNQLRHKQYTRLQTK